MDTHAAVMTTESLPWCHRMTVSSIISADSMLCFDWPGAVMRFHGAGHNGHSAVSMFPCVSNKSGWPISAASLQIHTSITLST